MNGFAVTCPQICKWTPKHFNPTLLMSMSIRKNTRACLALPCLAIQFDINGSTLSSGFDGFPLPSVWLSLTPRVSICGVYILHSPQLLVLVHCFQSRLPWATARYTSFYVQFCDSVNPVTASTYMAIPSESAILHSRFHRWQLHPFEQGVRGNSILQANFADPPYHGSVSLAKRINIFY